MFASCISSLLPYLPKRLVWQFSKQYIAGETEQEVLRCAHELNAKGIFSTIDILGECIETLDQAKENKERYLHLIELAEHNGIQGNYSLKPTFLGLLIDKDICLHNIREIVLKAASFKSFVRIDMEDSHCTQLTIEIFQRLYQEFPGNVGLVLQAYLHRTYDDLRELAKLQNEQYPMNLRICKGIYVESEKIAYKGYDEIREQYLRLLEYMMQNQMYPAIATHDAYLVDKALQLITRYTINSDRYEFQMLYGVTPKLRAKIVQSGHNMRVYLPFGKDWFGYSTRRLKENPDMLKSILKALFVKG